jgi:uncharacterized protein (PEP-CTERM system associated)
MLALYSRFTREPTLQPAAFSLAQAGGDVAELLDAILTTRYPDPNARAQAVRNLIVQLGLPATLTRPIEIFTDYAQLQQSATGSVSLLGRVSSLTLSAYGRSFRQVNRVDDPLSLPIPASANRQKGASLNFSRLLSATTTVSATLSWSQIATLVEEGDQSGKTTQRLARLTLQRRLSQQSSFDVGLRVQRLRSTINNPNVSPFAREIAGFAALSHRF